MKFYLAGYMMWMLVFISRLDVVLSDLDSFEEYIIVNHSTIFVVVSMLVGLAYPLWILMAIVNVIGGD